MSSEAIVTIPPDVVRIRASSTVFVNASSRVNRDFAGMAIQLDCFSCRAVVYARAPKPNRRWLGGLLTGASEKCKGGKISSDLDRNSTINPVLRNWKYRCGFEGSENCSKARQIHRAVLDSLQTPKKGKVDSAARQALAAQTLYT